MDFSQNAKHRKVESIERHIECFYMFFFVFLSFHQLAAETKELSVLK